MTLPHQKENPQTIASMFDAIAASYEKTNSVLTLGVWRLWNKALIKKMFARSKAPISWIDLCAGTGALLEAVNSLEKKKIAECLLVDFSHSMLEKARLKWETDPKISFLEQDVSSLLEVESATFNVATCSYGIRNVKNPGAALREWHRILVPEGSLYILELTRPRKLLRPFYHFFTARFLPFVGGILSGRASAYRYLSQSVENFMEPQELAELIEESGFKIIEKNAFLGGVATLFIAEKPAYNS